MRFAARRALLIPPVPRLFPTFGLWEAQSRHCRKDPMSPYAAPVFAVAPMLDWMMHF
jgi:hypothetical protein